MDSCTVREEQKRIKGLAEGQRIIASNWRGLGKLYENQGKHDTAQCYYAIARFDSARARKFDEQAQQVVKDLCPTLQRKTP